MTEEILQLLANAPGPQTAAEFCDALRRGGLKVEEFQLVEQLRRLQRDGYARLVGTRWRLLKMPAGANLARSPLAKVPAAPVAVISNGTPQGQQVTHVPVISPSSSASRWALFRRMCHYYMDCLLQDEAPRLRAYLDNKDDTWIAVRDVPWARLTAGSGLAVPLARQQAPFQRNRARRGEDECVYLSYPSVLVKP
jgi:hypothetical protein